MTTRSLFIIRSDCLRRMRRVWKSPSGTWTLLCAYRSHRYSTDLRPKWKNWFVPLPLTSLKAFCGMEASLRGLNGSWKMRVHRECPTAWGIHSELFGSAFNYLNTQLEHRVSNHAACCPLGVLSADTAKRPSQWKRTSVLSVEFKK